MVLDTSTSNLITVPLITNAADHQCPTYLLLLPLMADSAAHGVGHQHFKRLDDVGVVDRCHEHGFQLHGSKRQATGNGDQQR